jgi:hypothetical protein
MQHRLTTTREVNTIILYKLSRSDVWQWNLSPVFIITSWTVVLLTTLCNGFCTRMRWKIYLEACFLAINKPHFMQKHLLNIKTSKLFHISRRVNTLGDDCYVLQFRKCEHTHFDYFSYIHFRYSRHGYNDVLWYWSASYHLHKLKQVKHVKYNILIKWVWFESSNR